ncbi:hypothetical protein BGZ63DRAFT_403619 [Mariannaea sp. PMI_226]|nr:hypothetical protein BGZ63DRAFT_403619 [Mariannaea sp. PMI_226]
MSPWFWVEWWSCLRGYPLLRGCIKSLLPEEAVPQPQWKGRWGYMDQTPVAVAYWTTRCCTFPRQVLTRAHCAMADGPLQMHRTAPMECEWGPLSPSLETPLVLRDLLMPPSTFHLPRCFSLSTSVCAHRPQRLSTIQTSSRHHLTLLLLPLLQSLSPLHSQTDVYRRVGVSSLSTA